MKKTEIEFLRAAGFTLEEIMKFESVQNDGEEGSSSPGSQLAAGQNAQNAPNAPAQQPVIPAQQPVIPAQQPVIPAQQPVIPAQQPVIPAQQPVIPAQQPVIPAQQPVIPGQNTADNNPGLTDILNKILSAIQAGNMAAASIQTPAPQSPEDLAGKLY